MSGALVMMLAVFIGWSALRTRAERAAEVQAEAGAIARTAVTLLDEHFASIDAIASTLARDPLIRSLDAGAAGTLQEIVAEHPLIGNVTLRGPEGMLVASAIPAPKPAPSIPETAAQVLRTGRPAASQLAVGTILRRRTVYLSYPVLSERGAVVGVLSFSLELPRLATLFGRLQLPEGSVVALVDQRNLIVARSIDSEKYIGSTLESPKAGEETSYHVDNDGVSRFHGTATIERGPWALSVAIPRAEVLRRLAPLWRRNIVIMGLALVAVIGLALWISWQTAFTLRHLQQVAQRIAAGDFSPPQQRPVNSREMAQLQASFVTMAEKLRVARETLEQQFEQERKMLEAVRALQRQVVRQERVAAVGLLVSGVAHELNNPLQAILGNVELIERIPGVPEGVIESIALVKAQSDRANDIIRSLSRFSWHRTGAPEAVDLQDVIGEVLQLRRAELDSRGIAVDLESSAARRVFAAFAELEQVVLNFVVNAQQAIESTGRNGGRLRIRLLDTLRMIRLEVSDDGPGVPPEHEAKLFQPFFTTKPVGFGTGLGLSVSYGIIEAYGGTVGYTRNEWGGATFFFELPPAGETNDGAPLLHGRVPSRV
jgi:C4-dicarboxylate-specific signal transduction histidine kinase